MSKADEERAALEEKARLKLEASEWKKGEKAKRQAHDTNAENGPDGAQAKQPLPEDVNVEATAKPVSKPQNTFGRRDPEDN